MFYLYTGSSTSADSNFCVFGVLADDDSSTRFDELLDAIDRGDAPAICDELGDVLMNALFQAV